MHHLHQEKSLEKPLRSFVCTSVCSVFLLLTLFCRVAQIAGAQTQARTQKQSASAPKGISAPSVDYKRDVEPLFKARCYACHGNGTRLGGLTMDGHAALFQGGQSGPAIVAGDPEKSLLLKLVEGRDPKRIMPARGPRLTKSEIGLLRAWIAGGAKMGETEIGGDWRPVLALRRPHVPAPTLSTPISNPIDLLLQPYYKQHKIVPGGIVEDRVFARRTYLDLIGMLPTPTELQTFLSDTRPDKRARLADALLADNTRYAEHWLTFWNDMLRNDYAGTGYIDGGRTQITGWLYGALHDNLPYNRFVAQLVNPTPESAGFINGIVWRGVVNASQTPPMQAAQNIGQVFMGVNLKCASCHNSFVSTWKLADAYGMAGIYADKPLEMVRCDKPTGVIAPVKFMYPELGTIDGNAPRAQRQEQLAAILTSSQNGRLARTLVNRLWAKLMGHGLVEPTDDMDRRPWNPDVLDWLASDFVEHGYDMKHALRQIVTSRAYQMPAMSLKSEMAPNFVFAGPAVKRLSAEQYVDAVSLLTDVWQRPAMGALQIQKGQVLLPQNGGAQIKFQSGLMRNGSATIDIDITGAQTLFLVATDGGDSNSFDWADWAEPRLIGPKGELKLHDLPWRSASTGYGQIQINKSVVEMPLRIGEKTYAEGIGAHANSVIAYRLPEGYTRFRAMAGPDTGATEKPGSVTSLQLYVLTGNASLLEARAALAVANPLLRALDRPNREQVVTQRATVATTLQALELTNGQTLANMLEVGANKWTQEPNTTPDGLVTHLYETALGRKPTIGEKQAAIDLVGAPVQKAGVEDLLWAIIMLPEFQLIY